MPAPSVKIGSLNLYYLINNEKGRDKIRKLINDINSKSEWSIAQDDEAGACSMYIRLLNNILTIEFNLHYVISEIKYEVEWTEELKNDLINFFEKCLEYEESDEESDEE